MQKIFTLLAFFVMAGFSASSQLVAQKSTKNYIRCYTVERINEIKKSKPNIETDAQFESWMVQKIKDRKSATLQRPLAGNYTIPVVFHIIHNGEAVGTTPNLDAIYIQEQMLQLNKDFANVANSQYGVSATSGIQFVLAEKDPSNNILSEPGIDRINRNDKSWTSYSTAAGWSPSYIDGSVKPNSTWNSSNYYNIWVIPNLSIASSGILGYATFPSSSTLTGLNNNETANSAGVVILTATVGSTFFPGNCSFGYGLGKTLAHETGHFLGLRHIWGDANCGSDFCNDTPIHQEANYGKPAHPKSNSCGTVDEMFENYMDYCDDQVLNTFTANQVDRMQTVMLNSPRRLSLTTSNVGGIAPAGTNRISFTVCSGILDISEAGATGTNPRYKDVDLTLNVDDKATGSATVNITATGTAINNFHYQVLTPVLNYAVGDNLKNVKIRIFDNAEVDGIKSLTVSYAITGTGVRAGLNAKTVTINISDDDLVVVGNNPVSVYSENFGASGGFFPSGWLGGSFISPAGPNTWKVGSEGGTGITGQALYITNNATTKPLVYSNDQPSDAVVITPKIITEGYTNATMSFTYKSNGEKDADGTYDFGSLMYSFNNSSFFGLADNLGDPYVYVLTPDATNTGNISLPNNLQNTSFSIGFRWENDDNTGGDPPFLVDDILVNATPYQVETGVSSSYGFDIRTGAAINNFKSATNKVIATIKNASASLTGVTAQITQAGSGNIAFNTSLGTYMRTQKVFQISPTVANTTATYQATLYFTTAELAVWGADRLNLKILKVKDGVSLSSILNFNNAELITPTVVENVAGGYIAYTGNFTGFSQFILVSPLTVLPVSLVSFQATAADNNIQLVWRTSQENNNRGFQVERSLDGISFKQIGWINGNGTTSLTSTYNFADNFVQPGITYYYRILQIDVDNRQVYSQVRNARLKASAGIAVSVNPNPAKDFVNLLVSGSSSRASIELLNAAGQKLLQRNDVNTSNGVYNLPLPVLSKGIYTIMIYLPEGAFAKKIIIQ
jgi:Pregnancy-associated plasma protein-A/Secretion system C-terminal sorting domain